MSRLPALLGVLLVLVLSVGLAALNGGQLVTLRLGFTTLYGIPLTVVVFGSIILGMTVMLVAGIHTDLRVRRILRERLAREDEEERARIFVDRDQQDLFESVEPGVTDAAAEPGPQVAALPAQEVDTLRAPEEEAEPEDLPEPVPSHAPEPAPRTYPHAGEDKPPET